jgi:hypothetical protein
MYNNEVRERYVTAYQEKSKALVMSATARAPHLEKAEAAAAIDMRINKRRRQEKASKDAEGKIGELEPQTKRKSANSGMSSKKKSKVSQYVNQTKKVKIKAPSPWVCLEGVSIEVTRSDIMNFLQCKESFHVVDEIFIVALRYCDEDGTENSRIIENKSIDSNNIHDIAAADVVNGNCDIICDLYIVFTSGDGALDALLYDNKEMHIMTTSTTSTITLSNNVSNGNCNNIHSESMRKRGDQRKVRLRSVDMKEATIVKGLGLRFPQKHSVSKLLYNTSEPICHQNNDPIAQSHCKSTCSLYCITNTQRCLLAISIRRLKIILGNTSSAYSNYPLMSPSSIQGRPLSAKSSKAGIMKSIAVGYGYIYDNQNRTVIPILTPGSSLELACYNRAGSYDPWGPDIVRYGNSGIGTIMNLTMLSSTLDSDGVDCGSGVSQQGTYDVSLHAKEIAMFITEYATRVNSDWGEAIIQGEKNRYEQGKWRECACMKMKAEALGRARSFFGLLNSMLTSLCVSTSL